jgi:hypothetical protein
MVCSSGADSDYENAAAAAKNVSGPNEPDLGTQANTIPSVVAAGYQTYTQPFARKTQISSPAVTNAGNGLLAYVGFGWLDYFFDDCQGCQIDFLRLHWYENDTAANFAVYLTQAHVVFEKQVYLILIVAYSKLIRVLQPIWVTEFQLQDSDVNQVAFLQEGLPSAILD